MTEVKLKAQALTDGVYSCRELRDRMRELGRDEVIRLLKADPWCPRDMSTEELGRIVDKAIGSDN